MVISKIRVTNFKSFKGLEVELDKFNVLIGANASGKSNFIQIFRFLKDVISFGLDNAISIQGGIKYLRNINIGPSEVFSVDVVSDLEFLLPSMREEKEDRIGIKIYKAIYGFAMKFKRGRPGFEIIKDKLTYKCRFIRLEKQRKKIKEKEKLREGEIIFSYVNGKLKIDLDKPAEVLIEVDDIVPAFLREEKLPPKTLLLENPFFLFYMVPLKVVLEDISIYNFDPKLPKKASPITGKAELEEDGSNLSIILKNIIKYKNKKRKLFNLIKDLLPFVDSLDVKKLEDNSLLFRLREKYFKKKQYLLAPFVSDGTINITALITALYFEKKQLTIIEEPEKNIHPYLISKVVDMMKDASREKQIIVTTHNPEMVKHAGLKNILLVSRDKEGFSTISRPANKEEVKTFLKNEMGIEELFVQNLLGW